MFKGSSSNLFLVLTDLEALTDIMRSGALQPPGNRRNFERRGFFDVASATSKCTSPVAYQVEV